MRISNLFLPTLKEAPEAEAKSYQLMLRAALITKMTPGFYNYLPLGVKVLKRIEEIIREEVEKDFQEVLFSTFSNVDNYGYAFFNMLKEKVRSYKDLPLKFYQINTRYKDEQKPKHGLLKSKEFRIKEAYSFHSRLEELDETFYNMHKAYQRIFERCSLNYKEIKDDDCISFIVESDLGDFETVYCSNCGYQENLERVPTCYFDLEKEEQMKDIKKVKTPGIKTIEELVNFFREDSKKIAKTLIYKADDKVIAVMVRGDRDVSESKVKDYLNCISLELADEDIVKKATGAEVGFAGPIGINVDMLLVDYEVKNTKNMIVGANQTGYHIINVNYGRDFEGILGDFRKFTPYDKCPVCGFDVSIKKGIEVGRIVKLKDKYSKKMSINFVDNDGKEKSIVIGYYYININKLLSSIVEQNNDEKGIIWPISVSPYKVIIIPVNIKDSLQMEISEEIYKNLKDMGVEVLIDDRNERAGVKFNDADLIGIPMRIIVGKKINEGVLEFKFRNSSEVEEVEIEKIYDKIKF